MSNSMVLSAQWSKRPNDERYLDIPSLHAAVADRKGRSVTTDAAIEHLLADTDDNGEITLATPQAGFLGRVSHWAFGQLAQAAGAPAGYLRSLPADIARINLQWGFETKGVREDARLLLRGDSVAAATSTSYGRIWDEEVTGAILRHVDLARWKVPAASYASKDPKKATTLYASDRDVFAFLVDDATPIEVPGEKEPLFRGFYAYNSEVGSATFGLATFLYRYICDNRIIWGQRDFKEIKVRHTAGGPMRFMNQAVPQLQAYGQASLGETRETIKRAMAHEVGKDKKGVLGWLKARGFTKDRAHTAYENAEAGNLNPRSVWGLVNGLTDQGHGIAHTDTRADLERDAGKLLDIVS